jgi:tRNA pseudouridine-54 N-methylase
MSECESKFTFQWDDDEDDGSFVLDDHTELNFYSANSLKQHSSNIDVTPLVHIILILSWSVIAFTMLT